MTNLVVKIAPPNSVILISDLDGGEIPRKMGKSLVSATNTCVAVGCLSEDDGLTELMLVPLEEVNCTDQPVYEGLLQTPLRRVVIYSVLGQPLLEMLVRQKLTKIKVWANHLNEPDKITVGVR
jgi:hypothetical protein